LGKWLLALASAILGSESSGTMTIFYCLTTLGVVQIFSVHLMNLESDITVLDLNRCSGGGTPVS
jgi:hypothetical protein